jgi:hypothetical protein
MGVERAHVIRTHIQTHRQRSEEHQRRFDHDEHAMHMARSTDVQYNFHGHLRHSDEPVVAVDGKQLVEVDR